MYDFIEAFAGVAMGIILVGAAGVCVWYIFKTRND